MLDRKAITGENSSSSGSHETVYILFIYTLKVTVKSRAIKANLMTSKDWNQVLKIVMIK